jgi:alkanesulfonate monooxygenase SsuD/methylene tetrahydromethanopterin reductase-like flavin-dependent oxidoreductase (luciferase family)
LFSSKGIRRKPIVKIGISFPTDLTSPEDVFAWVKCVDAGPFSTLSILDRVVYSNYEPLITLATAASISTRVGLMTEVLLSPLRTTTILAKEIATLDVLSQGRLTLGLGVGVREDDFLVTGADYKRRGKRQEEQIHQMKQIWAGQAFNDNVGPIGPRPVQAGGPRILLGGFSPQAIQRVGRSADGFITALDDAEQINQTFRSVEQSWQAAGRAGKPYLVAQIDIALESPNGGQGRTNLLNYYATTPPFAHYKSAALRTTEPQIREAIHTVEQLGADEVIFFTWSTNIDQVDRIADLIG